jgi:hypothetical protein
MHESDKAGRGRCHYTLERWADFARGVTPDDETVRMAKHAETCAACRNSLSFCAKLTATTRAMALPRRRTTSGG